MSRICEEGLAKSLLDAMRQPLELAVRIMELRAYADAKRQAERTDVKMEDRPTGPIYDLAREIEVELIMEARGMGKK